MYIEKEKGTKHIMWDVIWSDPEAKGLKYVRNKHKNLNEDVKQKKEQKHPSSHFSVAHVSPSHYRAYLYSDTFSKLIKVK